MVRKFTITSVTEANSSDHLYYICTSCWKTSPQFETNVRRTCIHSLFLVIPACVFYAKRHGGCIHDDNIHVCHVCSYADYQVDWNIVKSWNKGGGVFFIFFNRKIPSLYRNSCIPTKNIPKKWFNSRKKKINTQYVSTIEVTRWEEMGNNRNNMNSVSKFCGT